VADFDTETVLDICGDSHGCPAALEKTLHGDRSNIYVNEFLHS
jgi:hypothetical protein